MKSTLKIIGTFLLILGLAGCTSLLKTSVGHKSLCQTVADTANKLYLYKDVLTQYDLERIESDLDVASTICSVTNSKVTNKESTSNTYNALLDLQKLEQTLEDTYGTRSK